MEHSVSDHLTAVQRLDAIGVQRSVFSEGEPSTDGLLWVTDKRQAVETYLQVRNLGVDAQVQPIDCDGLRRLSAGGLAFALSYNYDDNEGDAKISQHLFEKCIDYILLVATHIGEPGAWLWWDRLQIYRRAPTATRCLNAWVERALRPYHRCVVLQVCDRIDASCQSKVNWRFWPKVERVTGILSKGVLRITVTGEGSYVNFRQGIGQSWDTALIAVFRISTTSIFSASSAREENDKDVFGRLAVASVLIDRPTEILGVSNSTVERFEVTPDSSFEYNDPLFKLLLRFEYDAALLVDELVQRVCVVACGCSKGRKSTIHVTKFVPLLRESNCWRQKLSFLEQNAAAQYLLYTSPGDHPWWFLNDRRVLTKRIAGIFRLPGSRETRRVFAFITLEGIDIGEPLDMTCHCGGLAIEGGVYGEGHILGTTKVYFAKEFDVDLKGALTLICESMVGHRAILSKPRLWERRKSKIMRTDSWDGVAGNVQTARAVLDDFLTSLSRTKSGLKRK